MRTPHSPSNNRSSVPLTATLAIGLCALGLVPGTPQIEAAEAGQAIIYQVDSRWVEGNTGSSTVYVQQEGPAAIARTDTGTEPVLVSDPTQGILAARPDSNLPFLVEVLEAPDRLEPGTMLPMDEGWVHVVKSFRFDLQRGDSDRTIEGHPAEHYILTVDLELEQVGPDNQHNREHATGTANLWIAPDLPFSWLPYFDPQGLLAALPLSFGYPRVGNYLAVALADRLSVLGLLLRAETHAQNEVPAVGFSQSLGRETIVHALAQGAPLDRTMFGRPVLSTSDYQSVLGGLVLAGTACTGETAGAENSLDLGDQGGSHVSGTGLARLNPESEPGSLELVLGALDAPPGACVLVLVESGTLQAGEYPLAKGSADAWKTGAGPRAVAYYLRGSESSPQLSVFEQGSLRLAAAGPGRWQAELQGAGWTVDMTPGAPTFQPTGSLNLSFTVASPAGLESVETPAADTTASTAAESWSALSFDPTPRGPDAEWTFDGEEVRWGALDPRGLLAAVSLRGRPQVAILDLDGRTEAGRIQVKQQVDGNHVSALAFAPDGLSLAIGLPMGRVRIVDAHSLEDVQELHFDLDGSTTAVTLLAFAGTGEQVLGVTNNRVVVWDAHSAEVLATLDAGFVWDLAVGSGGNRAVTLNPTESVKVWDLNTASEVCAVPGQFSRMAMHPAGDRVAIWSREKKVVIASTDDCSELAEWPQDSSLVPELAWAADGTHLILGSAEGPLHLLTEDGAEVGDWAGQGTTSLVFTATGSNRVFSTGLGENSRAILWESQ